MIEFEITQGEFARTAHDKTSYVGNEMLSIRAKVGGYAEIFVQLGDEVCAEQIVAQQLNPFGDIICQYTSPVAGKVLSLGNGATREAGGLLVRILFNK